MWLEALDLLFSRLSAAIDLSKIVMIAGGGSGIGRTVALKLARRGAQIIIADRDEKGAETVTEEVSKLSSAEMTMAVSLDITSRESIAKALREAVLRFGGLDVVVNTAAIFPVADSEGKLSEDAWGKTFTINIWII